MKRNRELGNIYEERAASILITDGYTILERNYQLKIGEIDIIAEKNETIVFVEVKYRSSLKFGYGVEAVDLKKIKKIYRVARIYLTKHKNLDKNIRFDCISFLGDKMSWTKNLVWGDEIGF